MRANLNAPKSKIVAVVLGGGGKDVLAQHAQVSAKALVPLHGKPMGAYVLEALNESKVDKTVYVGPLTGLEPTLNGAVTVPAGQRMTDSLALGLGAALTQKPASILVVTADIPWISGASLDNFIDTAPQVDLVYPAIPQSATEAQFAGQKRTYAKVKEGSFTGGNLILITPAAVPSLLSFMDRLYAGRKNPFALAAVFGWDVVLKLLTGRAEIAQLETRASKLLGVEARAFITEDASLGADIDKPEHLAFFVSEGERGRGGEGE